MSNPGVPSRGHDIWLTAVITPIFTGLFIFLRMYTRFFVTKSTSLNDWVAFATLPFVIAYSVLLAQATYNGMGEHQAELNAHPDDQERMYFWIMVSSEMYIVSLAGYKASIILLYLSIFNIHRKFRYWCYAVLAFTLAYLFCNLITEVAGCHPIQKFWDKDLPGHCIKTTDSEIFYGACNMSSDLMIAILPIPMIIKLQLKNKRDKIGLGIVLGGGFIAFVVATVRYIYATVDLTSTDRTWIAGMTFLWSVLEINTGLMCSCTPALKPLLRAAKDQQKSWSERRQSRKDSKINFLTTSDDDATLYALPSRIPPSSSSNKTMSSAESLGKRIDESDDLAFEQMIRRA